MTTSSNRIGRWNRSMTMPLFLVGCAIVARRRWLMGLMLVVGVRGCLVRGARRRWLMGLMLVAGMRGCLVRHTTSIASSHGHGVRAIDVGHLVMMRIVGVWGWSILICWHVRSADTCASKLIVRQTRKLVLDGAAWILREQCLSREYSAKTRTEE